MPDWTTLAPHNDTDAAAAVPRPLHLNSLQHRSKEWPPPTHPPTTPPRPRRQLPGSSPTLELVVVQRHVPQEREG